MTSHVPDISAKRAALTPDATAFRDLVSGYSCTYAEFERRACCAAGLLDDRGVVAGDRVAILCRNRVEFFELLFACGKLGAIFVPLNWRMPATELAVLVDDAQPNLLFYGKEDAVTAEELRSRLSVLALDAESDDGYYYLREKSSQYAGRRHWPVDECWYLIYTSGTTGAPKGVLQTYGMAVANYVNIRQAMQISAEDVTLNFLPLFHTAGINLITLPTIIAGGEVLLMPTVDIDRIVNLLADGAIDTFFAVPAVYQQIGLHADFSSLDLSRIRSWGCGGAPLPDTLIEQYLERGARVCNGMGMTETGPTVFLMSAASVAEKIGSVGKPQLLSSVRIVDLDGNDVQPGESGEIWFSGPGVTPGYWQNAEATADAFSDDGWLKSGDIGRQDEDGDFYIVGRIKEMFISGGENVFPAEIENALATHPDILEAAVLPQPDEKWGEVGCAFVQATPGHVIPDERALISYCKTRLAAYKVPKKFKVVAEFPRTAAGKIQKHRLEMDQ